jgi:lipoprotein-releasing system permease protein
MFNIFDPDLQISPVSGKVFHTEDLPKEDILRIPGVLKYTETLEENALLRYKDRQFLATVKGVSPDFTTNNALDSLLIEGEFILQSDSIDLAIPGFGIAYYLDIHVDDPLGMISIYVPDRNRRLNTMSESSLRTEMIKPAGIFSVQQDFDNRYMFVPLDFVRRLLDYQDEVSSVEILVQQGMDVGQVQATVEKYVGENFQVKNRLQQQELLYKTLKSEKWAVFLILTFILIVATFNVIGSIAMLILDKRKDISTLSSIGADQQLIRRIFLSEGILITLVGTIGGMIIGGGICLLQQQFGLIKLHAGSFIMSAYPVAMKWTDFIMVFITVFMIGSISSWISVRSFAKRFASMK